MHYSGADHGELSTSPLLDDCLDNLLQIVAATASATRRRVTFPDPPACLAKDPDCLTVRGPAQTFRFSARRAHNLNTHQPERTRCVELPESD